MGTYLRTLDEIEHCGKETLAPIDVARYLGCHPHSISLTARQVPGNIMGSRGRIPRDGFVRWAKGLPQKGVPS